ncbi:signal peptidase I [Caproicibacter sp.]|uniref:signal peptidase I n=1 Tax=Caproicibacter sp. TaxID=2814884 RepID=UPI003989E1E8
MEKADPEAEKGKKPSKTNGFAVNCYEWIEALITSLIIVVLLFSFSVRVVSVSGPSMLPNLHSGDRILLFSGFYKPRQDDVVVITHTQGLSEPIIKRVIALENQTVNIDFQSGTVIVDGKRLDESRYIQNGITKQPSDYQFPLTVPKGCVFVLGDNRLVSNDSRSRDVGMVDQRFILGKAEWVLYPFDRFGKVNS